MLNNFLIFPFPCKGVEVAAPTSNFLRNFFYIASIVIYCLGIFNSTYTWINVSTHGVLWNGIITAFYGFPFIIKAFFNLFSLILIHFYCNKSPLHGTEFYVHCFILLLKNYYIYVKNKR